MIWEGWAKRRSAPKLKLDQDERGSSIPPSPQQHFKLERQGSKTTNEHQEQHLRIKTEMALYAKVSFPWQIFSGEIW